MLHSTKRELEPNILQRFITKIVEKRERAGNRSGLDRGAVTARLSRREFRTGERPPEQFYLNDNPATLMCGQRLECRDIGGRDEIHERDLPPRRIFRLIGAAHVRTSVQAGRLPRS